MVEIESAASIVDYWFSDRVKSLWFNATKTFDEELRERYLYIYQLAKQGELSSWEKDPEGALALVIVFDQLPLNMFRNQAEGFSAEALAREVADRAISRAFDADLPDEQKPFLYLPFMHSEDLEDQDRSVMLFEQAGLDNNLKWARHHRDLIRQFGRFPHRNAVLGRESSPAELEYLGSDEAFHG